MAEDLSQTNANLQKISVTLNEILSRISAAVGKTRDGMRLVEDAQKKSLDVFKGLDTFLEKESRSVLALNRYSQEHEQSVKTIIEMYVKGKVGSMEAEKALKDLDNALRRAKDSMQQMAEETRKTSSSFWGQMKSDFFGFVEKFKAGWAGIALDVAKYIDNVDVTTKRALIGLGGPGFGIGAGSVAGGGGLGPKGGFMPGAELSRAAGEAVANMMLMGQSSREAASNIQDMGRQIGPSLVGGPELVLKTAELATAFAKAGNITEGTANRVAAVLTLRFGRSAEQLGATMQTLRKDAFERARMSGELYSSSVIDLAMTTRTYSNDLTLGRAAVISFSKELKEGVLSIGEVSDMLTATRRAPIGQQAGIFQLGQQLGVRPPPGVKSPFDMIVAAGEKSGRMQADILGFQARVFQAMANQIAPQFRTGLDPSGRVGAARQLLQSNLIPGLGETLRGKSNEDIFRILNDQKALSNEIKKATEAGGKTPMDNLITEAQKITAGTTSIVTWLAQFTESGAFRVINKQITEPGIEAGRIQKRGEEAARGGAALQKAMEAAQKEKDPSRRAMIKSRLKETAEDLEAGSGEQESYEVAAKAGREVFRSMSGVPEGRAGGHVGQAATQAVNVVVKLPGEAIAISEKLMHAIAEKLRRKDYETHQEQTTARE
jgi:hypothetical protein